MMVRERERERVSSNLCCIILYNIEIETTYLHTLSKDETEDVFGCVIIVLHVHSMYCEYNTVGGFGNSMGKVRRLCEVIIQGTYFGIRAPYGVIRAEAITNVIKSFPVHC